MIRFALDGGYDGFAGYAVGSNTVQAQAAGIGRDHLPSDGPGGLISVYSLTL